MAVNFRVGGVAHNAFDIDADGIYLFLAVLNETSNPQILKMRADLSVDATVVYNPGAGSEIGLMAGDLSSYWVWAAGEFGSTNKVVLTQDGGNYWYVQNEVTWVGVARPVLVGPGDDTKLTTSTGSVLWQNRYDGDYQYWIERDLPGTIWAVDRENLNFDDAFVGSYWYTGDSSELVYYSPNSGFNWSDITNSLPAATITAIIACH